MLHFIMLVMLGYKHAHSYYERLHPLILLLSELAERVSAEKGLNKCPNYDYISLPNALLTCEIKIKFVINQHVIT
jgi:hypothetical protein